MSLNRVADARTALLLTPGDRHPGLVVKAFMEAWHRGDTLAMYEASQITWKVRNTDLGILQEIAGLHRWDSYRIVGYAIAGDYNRIDLSQSNGYWVVVSCTVGIVTQYRVLVVAREIEPYTPHVEGTWGVNPVSALRVFSQRELMLKSEFTGLEF